MKTIDADKEDITPEFTRRLATGEERAWREIWIRLLPAAMGVIKNVLCRSSGCAKQLRAQVEALQGSDGMREDSPVLQAEAALWSAFSSFRSHFSRGEMADARDVEQLACQFIRLAYNRWQRQNRSGVRLEHEASCGRGVAGDGDAPLGRVPNREEGPAESAARSELIAYIRQAADEVLEGFRDGDRAILNLYLESRYGDEATGQEEIAQAVGCSQATVSRVITRFHARMQRRFKEVV